MVCGGVRGGGGGRARGVVTPQSVSVVPPARRATPGTRRVDKDACVASVACVSACQCCCVVSVSRCRVRDVSLFSGQYSMFFSEVAEHANNARSQQYSQHYSQQCLNYHKPLSFFLPIIFIFQNHCFITYFKIPNTILELLFLNRQYCKP